MEHRCQETHENNLSLKRPKEYKNEGKKEGISKSLQLTTYYKLCMWENTHGLKIDLIWKS